MSLEALVGRHCGVVSETHLIAPEDGEPLVWVCAAASSSTVPIWGVELAGGAGGAGLDPESARRSALGEAAERYAAAGAKAAALILASPETARGEIWRTWIPGGWEAEPRNARWGWTADLSGRLAPAAAVFVPYQPAEGEWTPFPSISTGLAAGPDLETATRKGWLEAVERDAVARFWYGGGEGGWRMPLDVAPTKTRAAFDASRVRATLYGLDSWRGTPVALCVLESRDDGEPLTTVGTACAEDWAGAATKAMIEAAHDRHYIRYIKRTNKDLDWPPRTFAAHAAWPTRRAKEWALASSFLTSLPLRPAPPVEPLPIEGLRFDLTPRDLRSIGVSVARVAAPQLLPLPGDDCMRFTAHPRFPVRANPWPHPLP